MEVFYSYKGKVETRCTSSTESTSYEELNSLAQNAFFSDHDSSESIYKLKLLHKGKVVQSGDVVMFNHGKKFKVIVLATQVEVVNEVKSKRSDPTIRGFDQEKRKMEAQKSQNEQKFKIHPWGIDIIQSKEYKFCRFEACTWQSFGHRATDSTPHAFKAMEILEKLATDPGVIAIMVERELVVGSLGEMDPIDDRLMKKTAGQGGCLLGYNTNMGTRIDLKLRTDDLKGFRPYTDIVSTLIHELSHNWVGDHNALFWANFAQMRIEYLHKHLALSASGYIVNGKSTAQIADIEGICKNGMLSIEKYVTQECARDMAQHNLNVNVVTSAIRARCEEFLSKNNGTKRELGQRLDGNNRNQSEENKREILLAAAERRARQDRNNSKDGTT